MVTASQLADHRRLNGVVEAALRAELASLWGAISHLSPDQIKTALIVAIPDLIDKYGSMSASIAAEWYEELIGRSAVVPDLYKPEAYAASTRWAITPLYKEGSNRALALSHLISASTRHAKAYGREVIDESVARDPKVFYSRVPSGPSTCDFCLILASRGPVYKSRSTARMAESDGRLFHDDCDCVQVPMRGNWVPDPASPREFRWEGDQVAGYDFEKLYAEAYKPFWRESDTLRDVLDRMKKVKN